MGMKCHTVGGEGPEDSGFRYDDNVSSYPNKRFSSDRRRRSGTTQGRTINVGGSEERPPANPSSYDSPSVLADGGPSSSQNSDWNKSSRPCVVIVFGLKNNRNK